MDKNAIKKYAVWARRELISRVSQRAAWYGITEKDPIDEQLQAVHGHVFTTVELSQRRALIEHIRKQGYQQVMEEVAYTWFNRFIALRFMEVNGYLPSYVRVFSDENNAFNPQILKEALHLELEGLNMEKVYAFEEANDKEGLYKYLIITQCNDLYRMLPGMFQRLSDYTELLFPENLLREGSVIEQMVTTIPEEDWKDAVQIIGWLYQYYNAEPKDEVFAALKKNVKISKEKIPAATQLFTPDWIVRYMVENSLGRLWVEGHPNEEIKKNWKYYLEEAEQEPEVQKQLAEIRAEYAKIDPASVLCTDPCMGSGHILVYMFDVLMQIYLSYGYTTNEAVESIVRNNLWGMDIDDRAAQLAYFAVMMKARQYDRRWLAKQVNKPVQPNVFALQDSGNWEAFEARMRQVFVHHPSVFEDAAVRTAKMLFEIFADAKEYGSIIQPEIPLEDLDALEKVLVDMGGQADLMDMAAQADAVELMETLKPLIRQCRGLVQKYHVVVTNPPYITISNCKEVFGEYISKNFTEAKSDLFAVFLLVAQRLVKGRGIISFVTSYTWMFLASYEKLRIRLLKENALLSLVQPEYHSFFAEANVPLSAYTLLHDNVPVRGEYIRLQEFYGAEVQGKRYLEAAQDYHCGYRYHTDQRSFASLPGNTISYWLKDDVYRIFSKQQTISQFGEPKKGLSTGNNDMFLRMWHEVDFLRIGIGLSKYNSLYKWIPLNKGGEYRKWYGNNTYIINWENNGYEIKKFPGSVVRNERYYFRKSLTWTMLSSACLGIRASEQGKIFEGAGPSLFVDDKYYLYIIGLLCSKLGFMMISIFNPTMNININDIANIPIVIAEEHKSKVESLSETCIVESKQDWDSFEVSWDYKEHPFIWRSRGLWDATMTAANMDYYYGELPKVSCPLEICWLLWKGECEDRFKKLKANEEELNRIFIDIYGLQDELTPEVEDKDVTVRKADLGRDMRSFISYAVGCMFGRYSLDKPGLVLAGQKFESRFTHNPEGYQYGERTILEGDYLIDDDGTRIKCTYIPDRDGILPISDDEYFEDDIVGMFVNWLRTVFGEESLETNLKFVADALGGKGAPRDVLRQYFLNDFYKDHLKIYQKRPIYWLFDSGKKNGFKCLIYMHRYQLDTIARIRTDYVHETQARYRNAIETLERQSTNASAGEKVKIGKRLEALRAQAEEVRVYEEKIHHLADQMIAIDLDDGVKVNYAKFADVLAPIK